MRHPLLNEPPEPREAGAPFRTERVTESQFFGSLQSEWQSLHDSLSPRTPFTSPLWNALWWKHFRSRQLLIGNELFAHIVRDSRGRLVGVAPMMSMDRPSIGPLRFRTLRCFGADPNITELRGLVCEPQNEPQVFRALREHVSSNYRFDWIDWGAVREQNWQPVSQQLTGPESICDGEVTDFHLSMPATWDEFRASRSRNIKESIRKCYNSLKRDGHTARLRVVDKPEECAEAISTFLALHSNRSSAANTIQHADVFGSQQARSFLHELATASAQRNELRVFQLLIGEAVVATRIGLMFGDELYLYYSGYDTAWARYSVMTTLVVESLKWAIEKRINIVNLSTGSDVSKLRWSPDATGYRCLIQAMPGLGQRLTLAAYRFLRSYRGRGPVEAPRNACRAEGAV
jgi:CelD/BcsL family acetyltransferase involved in cellulose biosynthesis